MKNAKKGCHAMMTATLRGKSDAGNPHVRFDEGEVTPENPRRGSLPYAKSLLTMKNVSFVLATFAIGLCQSVLAETWYWSPKVKDGSNFYQWKNSSNWVTQEGESSRGSGLPAAGDTVLMGSASDSLNKEARTVDQYVALNEVRIGPAKSVTINQGGYGLQAGGNGLQFLVETTSKVNNWSRMRFYGTGEIPINVAYNGAIYAMQMGMECGSGDPILVKKGPGQFICFNQGGSDSSANYSVRLTLIRQGTWDMSAKGKYSDITVAFDGNDESQRLQYGYEEGWGNELTFESSALVETNGVSNDVHGIYDKDRGRQIAFTGTPKVNPMVFSGRFYGKAGLRWSPNNSAYVFVCSNAVSATAGKFSVEKGTVKLVTGASLTNLSELAVSAGAVFEVEAGSGADLKADTLTIGSDTSKLKLAAGVTLSVTGANVGGGAISPGTYTAAGGTGCKRADWIEGDGLVIVATGPEAAFIWKGGASGGNSVFLADNWTDGGEPDLKSGALLATFANGGAEANVPAGESVSFAGLVLANKTGNDSFNFTAGDGASVTVGINAIVANSSSATSWQCGWPITFVGDQTLSLGANDSITLSDGFAGSDSLTIDGDGALTITAPSTHSGALAFGYGSYRFLATDALGGDSRTVSLDYGKGTISFGGGETQINTPLSFINSSGALYEDRGVTIESNSSVTFNGQVNFVNDIMLKIESGSVATIANGCTASTVGMTGKIFLRGGGKLAVTNGTLNLPFALVTPTTERVDIDFWSVGNSFNYGRKYNWSAFNGRVRTLAVNALAQGSWIHLYTNAVFDLSGNDQRIQWFHSVSGAVVTSSSPARLTVAAIDSTECQDNVGAGDSNRVDMATFEGAVSFLKRGTLPHAFGNTSTSTGEVAVEEGTLRFTADGAWPNAATNRVAGGTLKLENAQAFGEKTVWVVSSSATVNLNFSGTIGTDRLILDGKRVQGTYGAVGSGAEKEVSWITGTGFLHVIPRGAVILLR